MKKTAENSNVDHSHNIITGPRGTKLVSKKGFTVQGIVKNWLEVTQIQFFVYDLNRSRITVGGEAPEYDEKTRKWHFDVLSRHISPGARALVYVMMKDDENNVKSYATEWFDVQN